MAGKSPQDGYDLTAARVELIVDDPLFKQVFVGSMSPFRVFMERASRDQKG